MTSDRAPTTIKKYANRRLYNTGTSAYVTLEDLAGMVKRGEDFVVYDAKNGEDITRSVLGQIIFDQEGKDGQSLLPITFLRQLIRFYGSSMQLLVPSYLEFSLDKLTNDKGFADFTSTFGAQNAFTRPMFNQIEEQTRQNMAMFRQALSMFPSFAPQTSAAEPSPVRPAHVHEVSDADDVAQGGANDPPASQSRQEFEDMKRQLDELQRRIESIAPKA